MSLIISIFRDENSEYGAIYISILEMKIENYRNVIFVSKSLYIEIDYKIEHCWRCSKLPVEVNLHLTTSPPLNLKLKP